MQRFKGLKRLVHDAVHLTTDLVEEMNESVAAKAMAVLHYAGPVAGPARAVDSVRRGGSAGVYRSIRGVNGLVSRLGDLGLDRFSRSDARPTIVPLRSDCLKKQPWIEDAGLGALNGVVGDYLSATGNALDLGMRLRLGDAYVDPQEVRAARVVLFVHGLATTEWSWALNAETHHGDPSTTFGSLLHEALGYTPVYLRYNSGRHISENGRQLADLLDGLQCEELVIIAHSMGGLVARSACHYGEGAGKPWVAALTHLIFVGTPHLGAPLERAGNVLTSVLAFFDVPGTQVPARVGNARSAGIKDLRHGYLVDEDWQGRNPDALSNPAPTQIPLVSGVAYTFIASTVTRDAKHPIGRVFGDLFVPTDSAHPPAVQGGAQVTLARVGGIAHHDLGNHPTVYARVLEALQRPPRRAYPA